MNNDAQQGGPAGSAPLIRYGGDAAFPPFEALDAQGRPVGFQMDLLAALGRELGAEIRVQLQPWPDTEAAFRAGQLDLVAMVDTRERREWARFARSHATPAFAAYHRRGQPDPQEVGALARRRVAVLSGDAMRETLRTWLGDVPAEFVASAGAEAALAAVQRGEADLALLPRAYGDRALAAVPGLVTSSLSFALQAYALAVPPARAAELPRLQAALDRLEASGELEALRLRWLSSHRALADGQRLEHSLLAWREWTWGLGVAGTLGLGLLGAALWRRGRRVALESTRRQAAEQALARAEELLSRAFVHNPEPMLVVERDGGIVRDANEALGALLGVPAARLVGQGLPALQQHVEALTLQRLVASLDQEGALAAAPLRLVRGDGQARECLVSADRMQVDGREHVFCLLRDITDQLARDAAMQQAYAQLQQETRSAQASIAEAQAGLAAAEAALQDFTRAVSHDLRSPLRAVQGFVGLLRQRLQDGHVQEALDYSQHIERAAQRMNAMIGALAGMAQVRRLPLRRDAVDMGRLARDTWTLLAAANPARHVECRLETLAVAQADADLAAQVWQNLLDNAWKYSAEVAEARVLVDGWRDDAQRRWYRVTDNGAGFDMARATLLFVPFQRMHSSQRFLGTGVGLSLVKRIVDHHEGEIRVRSAPGVGTVVEFTLDPPAQR